MDPSNSIEFHNVSVRYGNIPVLNDISAYIPRQSCTVLIGPNGAGKTTLLTTLLGDVRYSGVIDFAPGREGGHPRLGYVPQKISFDHGLPLTVLELLTMGLQKRPLWLGLGKTKSAEAMAALEQVQALPLASRRLGALSGGELQRVLLALALQRKPDLLLLDEPSAGMDLQGDLIFCALLEELRLAYGFTQIMVSHDLGLTAHHATHVLCLKRDLLAQGAPDAVFTAEILTSLFGIHKGLLSLPLEARRPGEHCA